MLPVRSNKADRPAPPALPLPASTPVHGEHNAQGGRAPSKKKKLPTQRSLEFARENNMSAVVVERWNPRVKRREDLWSIGDLIVMDDWPGVLLVQATSGANHANRFEKVVRAIEGAVPDGATEDELRRAVRNSVALRRWLMKGNRIEVWSWSKKGPRGKRKTWELRREAIPR